MKTKTFTFGDREGREVSVTAIGREQIAYASKIWKAADDEGTIQAGDAAELFSEPENATCMSLYRAFSLGGFEIVHNQENDAADWTANHPEGRE